MSKFIDFDKYLEEQRAKASEFTVFGKTYKLPPGMPYKAVLYLQSISKQNQDDIVTDNDMLEFFSLLFGKDVDVESWKHHPDFNMNLITKMLEWVLEQYDLTTPKDSETPETKKK